MFTAVALPALIFFMLALVIPESPRWLATRMKTNAARIVLARIGGEDYASMNSPLSTAHFIRMPEFG